MKKPLLPPQFRPRLDVTTRGVIKEIAKSRGVSYGDWVRAVVHEAVLRELRKSCRRPPK